MARRNVKVEIPISSPDDMKKLVEAIQEKHDELGPASPLDSAKVSSIADDMILSADDRKEGNKLHA